MNIYEENRILHASPVELVRILYTAAIRAVENARENLQCGDIVGRSKEISKAQAILAELSAAIDPSHSPEFSERLLALYDYMQKQLTCGHVRQEDAPLAEVSNLLSTLLEGWAQCGVEQSVEEMEPAFG
jgi:flagellar protein FliS